MFKEILSRVGNIRKINVFFYLIFLDCYREWGIEREKNFVVF